MSLVRNGRLDLVVVFAEAERSVQGRATLMALDRPDGGALQVTLDAGLEDGGPMGIRFERVGDELRLRLPPPLDGVVPDESRRLPAPESTLPMFIIRRRGDAAELVVPSTGLARVVEGHGGAIGLVYSINAQPAPELLAAAGLLQDGTWDIIVRVGFGGVARDARVSVPSGSRVNPGGHLSPGHHSHIRPYRTGTGSLSLRVEVHAGPPGWLHGLRSLVRSAARRLVIRLRRFR
jgi:hypothetical protein